MFDEAPRESEYGGATSEMTSVSKGSSLSQGPGLKRDRLPVISMYLGLVSSVFGAHHLINHCFTGRTPCVTLGRGAHITSLMGEG